MQRLLIFIVFIFSMPSWSEELPKDEKEPDYITGFFFAEGLLILNSYMASESPEGYGTLLTLLSPFGASSNASDTTNYVSIGGALSLGLYNAFELRNENYSRTEVFKRNMIGWHVFAASLLISKKLTDNKETIAYIAPLNDGAVLAINYNF